MSEPHRKNDEWDAAMESLPAMYCGRLDMHTWSATTGERQKMVYFDGEDNRVVCTGTRADFVAYAANRYQPLVAEIERLREFVSVVWSDARVPSGLHDRAAKILNRPSFAHGCDEE